MNDEEQIPRDIYKLITSVHNSFVGHMWEWIRLEIA